MPARELSFNEAVCRTFDPFYTEVVMARPMQLNLFDAPFPPKPDTRRRHRVTQTRQIDDRYHAQDDAIHALNQWVEHAKHGRRRLEEMAQRLRASPLDVS